MSLSMDTGVALCISETQNLFLRRQRKVDSKKLSALPSSLTGDLCGLRLLRLGETCFALLANG